MNMVKETRRELGLTQAGLAELLGVSRAQISLAEAGIRPFSDNNLIKLTKLKIRSGQQQEKKFEELDVLLVEKKEKFRLELVRQIEKMEDQKMKVEKQLKSMEVKFASSVEALGQIQHEQELFAEVRDYQLRLSEQFEVIKIKYLSNHPVSRLKLQWKFEQLQHALKLNRQRLNELLNSH